MRKFVIDKINKFVYFYFEENESIETDLKRSSFTARYNRELECWIVEVDDYSLPRILDIIEKYDFDEGVLKQPDNVKYDYKVSKKRRDELNKICKNLDFALTPRDYQIDAIDFSLKVGNVINGDDVGLGKTFEAILYAEATNSFPCLVIVPASVKYNWAEKWAMITKNKRHISLIESSEDKDWCADVVIINYDIIGKKQGKGATVNYRELVSTAWKMCIFDEAHFLKNSKSQRSRAAKKIVKNIPLIQMLSGTISMSRPAELWNLLILSRNDHHIAKDWFQFIFRYCGGYKGKFGWVTDGATNMIELNEKLRSSCYIRREKRDVLDDLPAINKNVVEIPITNKIAIKKAVEDLISFIRKTKGDEKAEKAMEAEHLVRLSVLRKLAIDGKLKGIDRYLKDWKECGKKLLVFGIHHEPLEKLAKKYNCMLIAGEITAKKKQEIVKSFIENDDLFLFCNMQSAGTGVDGLQTVAHNAIVIELPWKPSDVMQTIGRIDRLGQENEMFATFLLNLDTIDKEMWEMLQNKEAIVEAVNKGIDIENSESNMKAVLKEILKNN